MVSILLSFILSFWQTKNAPEPIQVDGYTMGTTYHITYFDSQNRNFKSSIDSLLQKVNQSINTYDVTSEVSRFNTSQRGIAFGLSHLAIILKKSEEVYKASHGAFDPTVMPLVNAWGFGPGKAFTPSKASVDSLKNFIGFDKIRMTRDSLIKLDPRVQLDFGGIGQGYGADAITAFLKSKGIKNLLVELGGEGMAFGKNLKKDKYWTIGILDPNSTRDNQFYKAYAEIKDQSFTTAGNYFNYREIDGKKYSHTIDPASGYPADMPILSASVFAKDCTTADAWDTAFMVMGHTKAISFLEKRKDLRAILMYTSHNGSIAIYISPEIKNNVTLER
jgi:thiamine biosynthesis lipoprotein